MNEFYESDDGEEEKFIPDVPSNFDVDSFDFSSMPVEIQHDILLNMRENARQSRRLISLPQVSFDVLLKLTFLLFSWKVM